MKKNILIILILATFNLCQAETYEYKKELLAFVDSKKRAYDSDLNNEELNNKILEDNHNENYSWYNLAEYKNRFLSYMRNKLGGVDSTKEDLPKLHKFVEDLCLKHNIEKPCIVVFPDKLDVNATASQLFNQKGVITIYGGLIYSMNDEELEAVLAHEIGHIKYNHLNKKMMIYYGSLISSYMLIKTCLKSEMFDKSFQTNKYIQLITASIISRFITIKIMRKYEKQADEFSHVNGHANGFKGFLTKTDVKQIIRNECEKLNNLIQNNNDPELNNAYQNTLRNLNIFASSIPIREFLDEHPTHEERIKSAQEYLNNQQLEEQTTAA